MKLYVGNLPPTLKDKELAELFAGCGTVVSAKVIVDHATGRSKGFGFVELSSRDEGQKAIKELHGKVVGTSPIVVNEARPQEKREGAGGGGFNKKRF
jgi:RNA recognition motif-containing protein